MGLSSIGVYLTIENEEGLSQCLERISPLADAIILLDQRGEEMEQRAQRARELMARLRGKEIEDEGFQLLLTCAQEDAPSLEVCISLGEYFYKKHVWKQAIFWFENTLRLDGGEISFVCLRLGTCYGELGQWESAAKYMKLAEIFENAGAEAVLADSTTDE
ncbi:hypothetical protein SAMN02745151_00750 [[Clostridium] propionicum DSM 1682]|uniref:Tetratricopeptide repeat protein n=1 Tax=Anaerotignum propionicum DSM 1682 TaxID=991789 RepID=A0A110A709_ANAPI|nr:hypothetical protein CPRO_07290 [Anaerotignum propionicum DSM 1682]SHE44849.1 hypothetical protein SAMN02745151_00750 [[Clostridium] propionicum DSM 1682] [Anaerotignum propionicum DSM 1682]